MIFFYLIRLLPLLALFFFFNDTAPTEISPLSLHDPLPIGRLSRLSRQRRNSARPAAGLLRLRRQGANRRQARPALLRPPLRGLQRHRQEDRQRREIGRAHV